MQYKIISIAKNPAYAQRAVDWFSSKWSVQREEYEKSVSMALKGGTQLPQWYLMLSERGEIIGGCGLIENDFVVRRDIRPYLCALYVEQPFRGCALGSELLTFARREAAVLGFDKLYLCTDHTSYYEKYAWKYTGTVEHTDGTISRLYECSTIKDAPLIEMSKFFNERSDTYDDVHISMITHGDLSKRVIADFLPAWTRTLLDIGVGTGLELAAVFERFPDISVTGVDIAAQMLAKARERYRERNIKLHTMSYFDYPYETQSFDAAISVMTLHHYRHEVKTGLYKKIYSALAPEGVYIECDYMLTGDYEEENLRHENELFAEYDRLVKEQGLDRCAEYHFDTPCTLNNQIDMLYKAGFETVEKLWQSGTTVVLRARKRGRPL